MNTDKHTCVCATCGQGFTRKSSAFRHNDNLHFGQSMIVKPYDYIIGRLNGEFSPSDPAIYRKNQRIQTSSLAHNSPSQINASNGTNFRIYPDVHAHESHPTPNSTYYMNSQGKDIYRGAKGNQWPVNTEPSYASSRPTQRDLKIQELEKLLYRNFPPQIAVHLLVQHRDLSSTPSNDAYIENLLNWLRIKSGSAQMLQLDVKS